VKWILRYIKGTIDVGLVFKKDFIGKQECIRYVDSDYAGDLDKHRSIIRMCLYCPKYRQLALYFTVYFRIVYYGGRVYDHDGGYEGGNLALRFA